MADRGESAGGTPPAAVDEGASRADSERAARGTWRRLRDWPVRRRLVALIVVPTVVALAFGVVGVTGAVGNALGDRHTETLAQLGGALTKAAAKLEDEQAAAATFAATGRPAGGKDALRSAYRAADASLTGQLRQPDLGVDDAYPQPAQARARTAAFRVSELPSLRNAVEQSQLPVNVVGEKYTDVISDLLALNDEIAAETGDPTLLASVRALGDVSRVKLQLGAQRSLVGSALRAKRLDVGGLNDLTDAVASQQSAYRQFQVAATSPQQQRYAYVVTGQDVDETQTILNQVTTSDGRWVTNAPGGAARTWSDAVSGNLGKVRQVERGLIGSVGNRAADLAGAAVRNAVIAGVVALLVLLVVLFATIMVARSLVRPLRALRGGALTVADERLPALVSRMHSDQPGDVVRQVEPIAVDSVDEVGQVARAFDEVHRVAARLAGEQAQLRSQINALFVSLSRRSQTLIERQLEVIDELEGNEQDADRLQRLFRLDHLATRMRRNGENLLVLGGQEPSRRFTEAMPLLDVLRAAASEVERYERIEVDPDLPGGSVGETAVTDVVHLVAELLDNATTFSPPDQPVRVRAYSASRPGAVVVEIVDAGIGLAASELEELNANLTDPPVIQPGVSRHMGLFVVARLARKHGIEVRLAAGDRHGLIARAVLPDGVVVAPRPAIPAEPAAPADAWPEQPAPGWPGQRWVHAMSATGAQAGSWFGHEPLPAIGGHEPSEPEPETRQAWREPSAAGRTSLGLPRRAPGANYVPGSLNTGEPEREAPSGAPEQPERRPAWDPSPEAMRSRFAAYQTGARRGHTAGAQPQESVASRSAGGRRTPGASGWPVGAGPTAAGATGGGPTGAGPTGAASTPAGPTGGGPTGAGPTGGGPTAAGQTSMGLPRREPGANYIPGSARTAAAPETRPPETRPPDTPAADRRRPGAPQQWGAPQQSGQPQQPGGQQQPGEPQPGEQQPGEQQDSWEQSPEALRNRFAAFQSGARRGHRAAGEREDHQGERR